MFFSSRGAVGFLAGLAITSRFAAASHRFCAVVNADEASGAAGWYNLEIDEDGQGVHSLQLDLSSFTSLPAACDVSAGLTYHIHSFWNESSPNLSGDNSDCARAATGNHYDPYLACGPNTEETDSCTALGRTSTSVPSYSYPCSSEMFAQGHYDYCEVGDTSGKFGRLFSEDPDAMLFVANNVIDPSPALTAAYGTPGLLSNQWVSVVVHCGSARIVCAKFLPLESSASCGAYSPSSDDDNEDSSFTDLTETEGAVLWSCIVVVVALLGVLVGYKCMSSKDKDDDRKKLVL